MNAKQLILSSALVFAGVVSAQTVPQEAWVGAPIATTGGAASRGEVTADLSRAQGQVQAPQEAWAGVASDTAVQVGELRRSEVMADLNLFTRAGLMVVAPTIYFNPRSEETARRVAAYSEMRNGVAFAQEVSRLEGVRQATAGNANGAEASAD